MRTSIRFVFLSFAFAALSCASFFAAPSSGSAAKGDAFAAFPSGSSGDYVVYRDYTWKNPTWIGFLRYDDTTWSALLVTPSTKTNVSVLFRAEVSDGKIVLTGQSIVSKISQADVPAVNYLMRLLPEMYGWRHDGTARAAVPAGAPAQVSSTISSRSSLIPAPVFSSKDLPSFGGSVVLSWLPEIPVFSLSSMTGKDGRAVLELARAGRIKSGGEQDFFGFAPVPEGKTGAPVSYPAKREVDTKKVDGIDLKLDGQWTQVADNTFLLGDSAVLIVDTIDLDSMGIASDSLALSLVRIFSLSSGTSWTIPSALSVSGSEKKFRIVNLFHDSESGYRNRDFKLCAPSADGKKCVIVSLSVRDYVWSANREYFDSLF